jgi:UDP-glucuronate 4-epimerase
MSLAHDGTVLLTGVAGFIGYHLGDRLLREGCRVVGVDSLNDYYDPRLKRARLDRLLGRPGFTFEQLDLADRAATPALFARTRPAAVVHLAAQAGVRYSLENPLAYVDANLVAFMNVLEGCRHHGVQHLVYASTSSVYGANTKMPFSVHDNVDHPVSLYAASKKANELMAHTYSHLYRLPTTGLRFFTVYGPWGRPDMALFIFTKAMLDGRPIRIFGEGRMQRDFTYIDDIVEGVRRVIDVAPEPDPAWSGEHPDPGSSTAPYRLYNIGNHSPVELLHMIQTLERALGVTAIRELLPMQPGDVRATFADIDDLTRATGFAPSTSIEDGIGRFVRWYHEDWLPIAG